MAGIHKFQTSGGYFTIPAARIEIWNFFAEYLQMLSATVHSLVATVHSLVTQTTRLPGLRTAGLGEKTFVELGLSSSAWDACRNACRSSYEVVFKTEVA